MRFGLALVLMSLTLWGGSSFAAQAPQLLAHNDEVSHAELTLSHSEGFLRLRETLNELKEIKGTEIMVSDYGFFHQVLTEKKEEAEGLYNARGLTAPSSIVKFSDLPQGILLASLFQNDLIGYVLRHNPGTALSFAVPAFYVPYKSEFVAEVFNDTYQEGPCAGEGLMASAIKGRCHSVSAGRSFIQKVAPHELVEKYGVYKGINTHLAQNQKSIDAGALNMAIMGRLLGIFSNADEKGFKAPLTPFDRHLFADHQKRFVKDERFSMLGDKCSADFSADCGLFFKGSAVEALLNDSPQSPYALSDGSFGLPVLIGQGGNFWFGLDHTLLSHSSYKNYAFFTGLELAVLEDLGFLIDPEEFYGAQLYRQGTAKKRLLFDNYQGFGFYQDAAQRLDLSKPSVIPMGVGLHAMTSYADITQHAAIMSIGDGALGIRVDGIDDLLTIPYEVPIVINGANSAGIAFTYGRGHQLNLDGNVVADGPEGVAVLADFGSNLYSDLHEYRGSYQRNSTVQGRDLPLPESIAGPLVDKINIAGQVLGNKAAIFINSSALVREINLTDKAVVMGSIVSLFSPYVEGPGRIRLRADAFGVQDDPLVQIPELKDLSFNETERFLEENLTTAVNFGVSRSQSYQRGLSHEPYLTLPNSQVTVDGDIIGESFKLNFLGGKISINGIIRAADLYLDHAVLSLDANGRRSEADRVILASDSVLDLVNGIGDILEIKNGLAVSSGSAIRVDADVSGHILDRFEVAGDLRVRGGKLILEPGLRYDDLRDLSTSPAELLRFMQNFVNNANQKLASHQVFVQFPEHIWDSTGAYGRELRCTSRGCRIGQFVRTAGDLEEELGIGGYLLSLGFFVLLIIGIFTYFGMNRLKNRITRI